MKPTNNFVIYIANRGCAASFELRKIHQVIPDNMAFGNLGGNLGNRRDVHKSRLAL